MFENIIYDMYGKDEIRYYFSLEKCKFGLILNKTNAHKEKEYTLKFLEEERERIEAWVKEWKERGVEKVIDYKVLNGKIFLVKRCYYLNYGEVKYRQRDLGYEILINPYVKDKDYIKAIENDFILHEVA